ncbi:hypothetical protein [Maritalea sp.]
MTKNDPVKDISLAQIGGAPLTWVGEMARVTQMNIKNGKKK